jgi:hypothetical protein
MEKLDYALGKLSVTARAELELVKLRSEVVIIHQQRVFLAIVCHCISRLSSSALHPSPPQHVEE